MFREPSGAACNSFELWETDLDLAAGLGLNAYRFSVEWARVEPEPDHFDAGAIEHYEAIVDGCLDRGLAPVVTFNHFTAPHWFAARGGFIDDDAPTTFARYCGRRRRGVRRSGSPTPSPSTSPISTACSTGSVFLTSSAISSE